MAAGFNDATLGSQRIGFLQGGLKTEFCIIDVSNDISSGGGGAMEWPTTLTNLLGWVGHVCGSAGDVSRPISTPISNMSLCAGPVLEISVAGISTGVDTANTSLHYIVWGW